MSDDQLRDLLHDAVADIEPTRDLEEVHARAVRPRVHWAPVTVAAALATVLVVTGTTWLVQGRGQDIDGAAAVAPTVQVVAYAVVPTDAGPRLAADPRDVRSSREDVQTAVTATLTGAPTDPDYRAVVAEPGGLTVSTGAPRDGVVTVDIETNGADLGTSERMLTQAVAWTVATSIGNDSIDVVITIDGSSLGDATRTDDAILAPITVESLADGHTVPRQFTVSGLAAVFEATVGWRVLDADGAVVQEYSATAEECCTPSPYSFQLDLEPGTYTLELTEDSGADPGEGYAPYSDTRRITVE